MSTLKEFNQRLADNLIALGHNPITVPDADGGLTLQAVTLDTGATLPWRAPASCNPNHNTDEIHKGALALMTIATAQARVHRYQRDVRIAAPVAVEESDKVWAAAAESADQIAIEAQAIHDEFTAYERAFYLPPPASLSIEQLADQEARQWLTSQHPDQLPAIIQKMIDGDLPSLLIAALRAPFPLPHNIGPQVKTAWLAHLGRTKGEELQRVKDRRERVDWLKMITLQVATAIPRKNQPAVAPVRRVA